MAYRCYGIKTVETSNSFFTEKVFLPSLESLMLSWIGEFEKLWCGEIPPDQSYCNLQYLHVQGCYRLRTVIPASMIERLHKLKQLWVIYCDELEVVFDMDVGWNNNNTKKKSKSALVLPQLQEVKLERLQSLRHFMERVSDDDEIVVGFPSLKRLEVSECNQLINLISTNTATTLLELNSLHISFCSELLEVVSERPYKKNAITFPHLTSLCLADLDSLTCFSSDQSHRFDFTRLKILKIHSCKSFKTLINPRSDGRRVGTSQDEDEDEEANTATRVVFNEKIQLQNLEELYISNISEVVEELWNEAPTTSSFCKLKILEVSECLSLQNVIPSFMVKRLQNLERLCISSCDSLQDIFNTTSSTKHIGSSDDSRIGEQRCIAELESVEESRSHTHEITNIAFPKLTFLKLGGNIQLINMWSESYTLEMPYLKKLVLDGTNATTMETIMEKIHLPNLEALEVSSLEIAEVWHIEPVYVGSFNKLKDLQIEKCGGIVKVIPFFMLERLQNLEVLVVKDCNKLEIICELTKWLIESESNNKLLACFPLFQKLVSIHVEKCECLGSLFSIISAGQQNLGQYVEILGDDFDDKIVQLPQLTHLKLVDLPKFNHLLFQKTEQYAVELPSLNEFFLIGAGDKEAVTYKVAFPEGLEIQLSYFFGSTSSVLADIVKALQQKTQQDCIIGLVGSIGDVTGRELARFMKEATNLELDQVVYCGGTAESIQDQLGWGLGFVYGETDVQGRAVRLRKGLLRYIRNKRLLLIVKGLSEDDEGILEAAGVPSPLDRGVNPKQFKIILISEDKELLLKMGATIIPIGSKVEDRWDIFKQELQKHSREAYPTILQQQEEEDLYCFVGEKTIVLNNMMAALLTNNQIMFGILGPSSLDGCFLCCEVGRLLKQENLIDETVDSYIHMVETIQEELKIALGIISTTSSSNSNSETDRECIRQTLISTTTTSSSSNPLQQKRLLLMLNKLDEEVDLEAVGIPPLHQVDPKHFKLILTSEKRQVLQNMGAQQVFELQSSVSPTIEFCRIVDGYLDKSDLLKLADECGSDDLAKLLAKKLKSQGMRAWANAFQRLKESPFSYEERKKVIASLIVSS